MDFGVFDDEQDAVNPCHPREHRQRTAHASCMSVDGGGDAGAATAVRPLDRMGLMIVSRRGEPKLVQPNF